MTEPESTPLIRPLNFTTFIDNMADRVKEHEIEEDEAYPLVIELTSGQVVEFSVVRAGDVIHREMGTAGLLLSLYDPEVRNRPFQSFNVDSRDGLLRPRTDHRINDPRRWGHIGYLSAQSTGYLLNSPAVFHEIANISKDATNEEQEEQEEQPVVDTWTRALELEGISIGNN